MSLSSDGNALIMAMGYDWRRGVDSSDPSFATSTLVATYPFTRHQTTGAYNSDFVFQQ